MRCCVKSCENTTNQSQKKLSFFSIPPDVFRQQAWLKLLKLENKGNVKGMKVCSEHFEKKYIIQNERFASLRFDAIPTIFGSPKLQISEEDKVNPQLINVKSPLASIEKFQPVYTAIFVSSPNLQLYEKEEENISSPPTLVENFELEEEENISSPASVEKLEVEEEENISSTPASVEKIKVRLKRNITRLTLKKCLESDSDTDCSSSTRNIRLKAKLNVLRVNYFKLRKSHKTALQQIRRKNTKITKLKNKISQLSTSTEKETKSEKLMDKDETKCEDLMETEHLAEFLDMSDSSLSSVSWN